VLLEYCGALVTRAECADHALAMMRQVRPEALVVELAGPGRRPSGWSPGSGPAHRTKAAGFSAVGLADESAGAGVETVTRTRRSRAAR
jgi:hypothetical protein